MDSDSIGDRLKWCRERSGYTQQDLADASGVALVTIRRIEQGIFEPQLDTVRRLAGTLYVPAGWVAFGEGVPSGTLGVMVDGTETFLRMTKGLPLSKGADDEGASETIRQEEGGE